MSQSRASLSWSQATPMTPAALTSAASRAGAGMLIDPFFKAQTLRWLLEATQLTRVLVSKRNGPMDLGSIATALGHLPGASDRLEVRVSAATELHDRAIVGSDKA